MALNELGFSPQPLRRMSLTVARHSGDGTLLPAISFVVGFVSQLRLWSDKSEGLFISTRLSCCRSTSVLGSILRKLIEQQLARQPAIAAVSDITNDCVFKVQMKTFVSGGGRFEMLLRNSVSGDAKLYLCSRTVKGLPATWGVMSPVNGGTVRLRTEGYARCAIRSRAGWQHFPGVGLVVPLSSGERVWLPLQVTSEQMNSSRVWGLAGPGTGAELSAASDAMLRKQ